MEPPYSGPETTTSLRVLEGLVASGLPEPVMLLGGWAVYFTVHERWRASYGEGYFGSRDIDLGFDTPPHASLETLRQGNMPATLAFLVDHHGFHRQGMYQLARHHAWETHRRLDPLATKTLPAHAYYTIIIDLIASHQREDLRELAGFQAFSEPLLALAFESDVHRTTMVWDGKTIHLPAPHVLIGMKLRSLPQRQHDDKSIKDICDLFALTTTSGVGPRTLRSRLHRMLPDAAAAMDRALASPIIEEAAHHLDQSPGLVRSALGQLV
jgi:hypothetical protein